MGGQSANLSFGRFQLAGWSSFKWWTLHYIKSPTFPEGYLSFNWQTELSVVIPQIGQKCISWRWNIYPGWGFRLLGAFGTKESINIKVSSKNVTIAMHCSVLFLSLLWTQAHLLHLLWISTVNKQWLFIHTTTKELRVIEHYSGIWFCAQCTNLWFRMKIVVSI